MVEILGLAGSGKSTLAKALCDRDDRLVAGRRFNPTELGNIPSCLRDLIRTIPTLVPPERKGRRLTRREIKVMLALQGWRRVLQRQAAITNGVIVLDQGPVFKLANLYGFGPEWLKQDNFGPWWDHMFNQWSAVLDMVVWLDAPREVLVQRIRARRTWHAVKEKSVDEAEDFLATYQASCEHVVSRLARDNLFTILRFDTSRQLLREVVGDVMAECNLTEVG